MLLFFPASASKIFMIFFSEILKLFSASAASLNEFDASAIMLHHFVSYPIFTPRVCSAMTSLQ